MAHLKEITCNFAPARWYGRRRACSPSERPPAYPHPHFCNPRPPPPPRRPHQRPHRRRRPAPSPIPQMTAPNYRAIVARNQDAVVGITTAGLMPAAAAQQFGPGNPFADDDNPLSQFFRGRPAPGGRGMAHAQGSGFLISSDGLVLTNAHVVDGAKEVTVKLSDHREFKARVLGADRSSDIAVLKIDGRDFSQRAAGRFRSVGRGRLRPRHRRALRPRRETATAGIVSAKGPLAAGRRLCALHSDRCRRQSGQFRRPAVRFERRRVGHQCPDLYQLGRLPGRVLRHTRQSGGADQGPNRQDRQSRPFASGCRGAGRSISLWPSPSSSRRPTARWWPRWRPTARRLMRD